MLMAAARRTALAHPPAAYHRLGIGQQSLPEQQCPGQIPVLLRLAEGHPARKVWILHPNALAEFPLKQGRRDVGVREAQIGIIRLRRIIRRAKSTFSAGLYFTAKTAIN